MSRLVIRVLVLSFVVEACILCPRPKAVGAAPPPGYTLVWSDEFHGPALDTNFWSFRAGPNDAGTNTPNAVAILGDKLVITTYTSDVDGKHYTGWIQTGRSPEEADVTPPEPEKKYMPKYGYIEASIDFDDSKGMWSSFFVQTPNNYNGHPDDPRDRGTEMDIVEHTVWSVPCGGESTVAPSALHWITSGWSGDPACDNHPECATDPTFGCCSGQYKRSAGGDRHSGNGSLADGLHTYGLEWTPDVLHYLYDGQLVWTVNNSPDPDPQQNGCGGNCFPGVCQLPNSYPVSHTEEFIVLGAQVTNNSHDHGPIPPDGYGPLSGTLPSTTKMKVDYVRHYVPAPTGLVVTSVPECRTDQVDLAWNDNAYGLYGYTVERSTDGVNFSVIATVGTGVHEYHDMAPNATRCYRVKLTNSLDNLGYSNTVRAPAPVTDLRASDIRQLTIAVNWTAPGDDGQNGIASQYQLRRSMSPIGNDADFNSADLVATSPPHGSGFAECKVVTGLSGCTTNYFAIKTRNAAGFWSPISNVLNAHTLCAPSFVAECDEPPTSPAVAGNLSVQITGHTTAAVSWTIPPADGTPMDYDLRFSTSNITASNFASANHVRMATLPHVLNGQTCRVVDCLLSNTSYKFAVKIRDQAGNWSAMSNVFTAATTSGSQEITCAPGYALRPATEDDGSPSLSLLPSPNPTRGGTSFQITVPGNLAGAKLRVQVFDVAGRRVRSLVDRNASPGRARVDWNLLDDSGRRVAPALYTIRVEMGNTRKGFPVVVLQ